MEKNFVFMSKLKELYERVFNDIISENNINIELINDLFLKIFDSIDYYPNNLPKNIIKDFHEFIVSKRLSNKDIEKLKNIIKRVSDFSS
jgi:hypothetical protein